MITKSIIKFFSHSDHAVTLLDKKGVWRLQKFSKTQFGNMSWVCQSLHEAFLSICKLVQANEITIKVYSMPKDLLIFILSPGSGP